MVAGEGLRIAGGLAGIGLIVGTFIAIAMRAERKMRAEIGAWPQDESELSAEALIPEYAAARQRCGCAACQRRPQEPCSDFDGD